MAAIFAAWGLAESNRRHNDFQSFALPLSYVREVKVAGFEPTEPIVSVQADEGIRTLDVLLGKEVLYR